LEAAPIAVELLVAHGFWLLHLGLVAAAVVEVGDEPAARAVASALPSLIPASPSTATWPAGSP